MVPQSFRVSFRFYAAARLLVAPLAALLAVGTIAAARPALAEAPAAQPAAQAHQPEGQPAADPHAADPHAADPHAAAAHGGHAEHPHPEPFTFLSLIVGKNAQHDGHVAVRGWFEHQFAGTALEKTLIDKRPLTIEGHITHVFFAAVAMLLVLGLALAARRKLQSSADAGVMPERSIGALLFFEVIVGAVWNMMKGMMGPEEARRQFPLVCTLAVYIFVMNALALLPLGAPATDNLNTNIVMGLTVFVATHVSGLRAQGVVNYAKHFAGPILALAPLMIIIEVISHAVRPVSLSLRLMGNMYGDHKVMENFLNFHIPLVPLPVMFLGLIVVIVQTVVFTLLSTVYLSMATAHHDDHGEGHEGHGNGHDDGHGDGHAHGHAAGH